MVFVNEKAAPADNETSGNRCVPNDATGDSVSNHKQGKHSTDPDGLRLNERLQSNPQRPISHETLRAFFEIEAILGVGSMHVASIDPDSSPLPGWMRAVLPGKCFTFWSHQVRHLQMVSHTNRQANAEIVLFLDATCWSTLYSMILPMARHRELLFLSMFHQQLANNSRFRRVAFWLFRKFIELGRSRVLLFECDDDCVESELRFDADCKVVLPMPRSTTFRLNAQQTDTTVDRTLKVGLGGTIRPQKGTLDSDFLSAVMTGAEQCSTPIELIAGIPGSQGYGMQLPPSIQWTDTDDYDDYVAFIESLDVLVVNLRRDHYWYRSSGVVHDALSAGVFVIVNDYPVVRSQVSNPVAVGQVFSDLAALSQHLVNLPQQFPQDLERKSETWNRFRSPAEIATTLKRCLRA